MSRAAEIALQFAGEERVFRLPVGRWRAVQEKCDAGPAELLRRYVEQTWRLDDLREVVLQGLIGGGLEQAAASRLMASYFDGLPLQQFVPIAQAIVMASLVGAPDEEEEPAGEPAAGAGQATSSRAES